MIKILIAFVVFSAAALFILMKGGDIDMSGESHGIPSTHNEPAKPAQAPAAASPAPAPAAPASEPAPAK